MRWGGPLQAATVRLAWIDAPEMAQVPDGVNARSSLRSRLRLGSSVTLRPQTIDRYGRTVAEVIGEVNLNLAQVEEGMAYPLRGPAAIPTGSTWTSATPESIWMPPLGLLPRQNVGAISQDLVMFESEGMHWGRTLSSGSC